MTITTSNYHELTRNIDWNAVPASLKKMHETLIPDAAKSDWKVFNSDEDVKRVVEKFFGYMGKYVPTEKEASVAIPPTKTRKSTKSKTAASPKDAVEPGAKSAKSKLSKADKTSRMTDLPQPRQVEHIPTATVFIKRYATLNGKVKTRDQILSLAHGLQKAITEQRIKTGSPALLEIEKMQKELITLASTMGESAQIQIDEPSLAHYKEIAQGEEVRTSVKLIKSFITMTGKAYDKKKAGALLKRMETASEIIPKEDAYLTQLITAMEELSVYVQGKEKTVGIPSAGLHGLGAIAGWHGINGLAGASTGTGEGTIIRLLRNEGVKTLSDAALKKAFRQTAAPGLCLEIARSLIRRRELSMDVLNAPPSKKKSNEEKKGGLNGLDEGDASTSSGRITDLDILEMRLQNNAQNAAGVSGLGNPVESYTTPVPQNPKAKPLHQKESKSEAGQIMSAAALKTMKFDTIGLKGKWKALIGDPAPGFSAMVYGLPKQGKSTFCLQLANDLAKLGEVLYCALEEGFGATLSEKLHRLGIDGNGLQFGNTIPQDLRRYKFVFIDSVSEVGMDAEGLRELRRNNPSTAFIFVYHSTKAGNFRGSNTDAHDVDVIIEVKDGMASSRGRYAPPSEMTI